MSIIGIPRILKNTMRFLFSFQFHKRQLRMLLFMLVRLINEKTPVSEKREDGQCNLQLAKEIDE